MTDGTIFFICSTSAISALSAVPRIFSLNSCTESMAKRMQEQSEENRIVAKSRPTAMNLTSFCCYKFFICEQSDCVETPRRFSKRQVDRLDYQGGPDASTSQNSSHDAASSSQVWQRDAQTVHQHRETCRQRTRIRSL